jgi:hypothetical protein
MNNQSAAPHFFDIPLELFRSILGLLDDPDLLSIALTCKQFKDAAIDELWEDIFRFPDMLLLFPDDVWDRELMVRRCKQSAPRFLPTSCSATPSDIQSSSGRQRLGPFLRVRQ